MKKDIPAEHGGQLQRLAQELLLDPSDLTDFSSSLNPLGPPAVVKKILAGALGYVTPYPDMESEALKSAIALKEGLDTAALLVGNGSTELIFLIARALRPAVAAIVGPTFSEYERAARLAGSAVQHIRLNIAENFGWEPSSNDREAIAKSAICFICNPNNPSGTLLPRSFLKEWVARYPKTLFVVDEAFVDFLSYPREISLLEYCEEFSNLIVLRSFTKFFAIAGLRLGYAAAHPALIKLLRVHKEPWTVNGLAQAVGERLLEENDFAAQTRRWLPEEREWMECQLRSFPDIAVFESHANYLLLKIKRERCSSGDLFRKLLHHRVVVRDAANFHGLDDSYVRVAVRTRAQNKILLSSLESILSVPVPPGESKKNHVR